MSERPERPDYRLTERRRILARYRRQLREIELDFNSAAYWNEHVRKADEEPIEYDPSGEMKRLMVAIEELLDNDPGHGPIAKLRFTRSH